MRKTWIDPKLLSVFAGLWPVGALAQQPASPPETPASSVTVPFVLDHNRILVDLEIRREDGTWRGARIWLDTGEPVFSMSEALARDLGLDLSTLGFTTSVPPPAAVRIGPMPLDFTGIETRIGRAADWQYHAMHNDGHLSSRVLQRYQVIVDYPGRRLTIAEPGSIAHRGTRVPAAVHPETGIVQIDTVIDGDSLSFALDLGASYSFADAEVLERLLRRDPGLPRMTGTAGCANMWGWWPPGEEAAPVVRVPEIRSGPLLLSGVGIVGVRAVTPAGLALGTWYSRKTAHPVNGFLGPNAFRAGRVEIDYAGGAVYFERVEGADEPPDMDLVGLALRPENDGSYTVIGVVRKDATPAVEGVEAGDRLLRIADLEVTGATMGTVVDALRGRPGEVRRLLLDRDGTQVVVEARVERLL